MNRPTRLAAGLILCLGLWLRAEEPPPPPLCVCPVKTQLDPVAPGGAAKEGNAETGGDASSTNTNATAAAAAPMEFIALGAKERTVEVLLIATFNNANYGMNFNGFAKGAGVYTVPTGWTVNVTFRNNSPVPHSVIVVEEDQCRKLQFREPYFDDAATPDFVRGTTNKEERFSFVPDEEGEFAFACGFPAHSANGHWIKLVVSDDAATATWQAGEADPVEAKAPAK